MRTFIHGLLVAMTVLVMAGCAGNRDALLKAGETVRQDVFREASASAAVPPGKALLQMEFQVKGYKDRIFNTYIKHSDPPYTVTVTIDGQPITLADEPVLEDLPGDFKKNPEVGTGWRYTFKKSLLLQPGKHRVSIAITLSGVILEKEIDLKEGKNTLTFSPLYNASVSRYPLFPRFSKGLRGITMNLNKQDI